MGVLLTSTSFGLRTLLRARGQVPLLLGWSTTHTWFSCARALPLDQYILPWGARRRDVHFARAPSGHQQIRRIRARSVARAAVASAAAMAASKALALGDKGPADEVSQLAAFFSLSVFIDSVNYS